MDADLRSDGGRGSTIGSALYLIVTSTTAGVIALTPKFWDGSTWTRRLYRPGPSPARSTNASMAPGAQVRQRLAPPRTVTRDEAGLHLRAQAGAEVAPPHRHVRQLALDRRRQDLDDHRRRSAAGPAGPTSRRRRSSRRRARGSRLPVDRHRLGRRLRELPQRGSRARRPRPSPDRTSRVPTTKPGAGSPSIAGTTGTVRRAGLLELERERAGHDLRDLDAERRAHLVVAEVEEPRAGRARAEVEHGDDLARLAGGSARADDPRSRTSTRRRADRRRSRAPAGCSGTRAARAGCARRRARRRRSARAAPPARSPATLSPRWRKGW